VTVTEPVLEHLAFYTLAGQPGSSRDLIGEVVEGEALGLGTAFISERYDKKEAATLSGAAGAVSKRITIATAATNHNTRHPMVTAGYARTMQSLTGGRFVLGLGRGVPLAQDAYGIPHITTAQMEDFAGLMRRLFRGEVIIGHDGPAGSWPVLFLDAALDEHLPMGLVAFGPNTLALAGRCFDEVVLHTFFTDETTARCVQTVKRAAEQAGRDPAAVKVWSCFATVGDHIPEDKRLMKMVGRLATYLQGYGALLVRTNGWDEDVLARILADPVVASVRGLDVVGTPEQLEHVATLIPDEWLSHAATGSPSQCVAAIRNQFDLGCDGVIMHGATPAELAPVVAEYRRTADAA
jgi:probable F420-dependent oxidoreductase